MSAPMIPFSLTMSSREIAELTGKNHADVLRDIRSMLASLEMGESSFAGSYRSEQNKEIPCFNLPENLTLNLVAGYNAKLRLRIIDRWKALEREVSAPALPNFADPVAAARAWADQVEVSRALQIEAGQLQAKIEEQAPTVQAFDRIANGDGSMCVTDAAKSLQVPPKKLFAWMSERQWIYRRPGGPGWIAYQDKIQSGMLEHKVTTVQRGDGTDKTTEQVRVTGKGLATLAKKLGGAQPLF